MSILCLQHSLSLDSCMQLLCSIQDQPKIRDVAKAIRFAYFFESLHFPFFPTILTFLSSPLMVVFSVVYRES